MSLTKVTNSMISGAPVNVLDFGAVGDGTTDNTSAFQAAFDYYATLIGGSTASTTGYVGDYWPEIIIPQGTYICGEVNLPSRIRIRGQGKAIIQRLSGTYLAPTGYWSNDTVTNGYIENVGFLYFDKVLRWQTGNLESSFHTLKNITVAYCNTFFDQVGYAESRSTTTLLDRLQVSYGVNRVANIYSDISEIRNSWLTQKSDGYLFAIDSFCHFVNNVIIPDGTPSASRAVIYFSSSDAARNLVCDSVRFGGEPGQSAIVVIGNVNSNGDSDAYRNQGVVFRKCDMSSNNNFDPSGIGSPVNACVILNPTISANRCINFISFQDCYGGPDKSGGVVQYYGTDDVTTLLPAGFSIQIDNTSMRSFNRGVNKPTSTALRPYVIAPLQQNYVKYPNIGTGKTAASATATTGQWKSTFNVNMVYPSAKMTPFTFLVTLVGQGDTSYPSDEYAYSSVYILTISSNYISSDLSNISFTKLHGSTGGVSDGAKADIVSAHFGTGDTGATTRAISGTTGGNSDVAVTIAFGTRVSTATAYIRPLYDFSLLS
jgi:hypothetical protein